MTNQHPIIPPPELVEQLRSSSGTWLKKITNAYQAGADQELEACCEWFICDWTDIETADKLRAARRPKPPSLKEQALGALEHILHNSNTELGAETIRRALEALDD